MSSSLKLDFFIWLFLQVAWPCGRACYTRFSRAFKWLGFWGDGHVACAFKAPPAPPAPEEKVQSITVSWRGDREYSVKRFLTRANDGYNIEAPITLSSPVPWSLWIEGSLPLTGETYVEGVEAHAAGKSIALAANLRDSRLEVTGLRTVLEEGKAQRAILVLRARDAKNGANPWVLRLTLLSLPVSLNLESLPPGNFSSLRRFSSPNMRLDLLKVIRVKNTEEIPLEIRVHGKWLPGTLIRRFTTHQIYRINQCRTDYRTSEFFQEYITDFALLPLEDSLPSTWTTRLFDRGKVFRIDPGKELLLGLYGSGRELPELIDNGVPNIQPQEIEVPVACRPGQCDSEIRRCPTEIETARMKNGLEGHEIAVTFEDGSHTALIRYGLSSLTGDPASKTFELMPASFSAF